VAEANLRALLERHVELFNDAVRTGDYDPYLETFADNAVMRFDDIPVGPFRGKSEIAEAYATQPPSDTIALIDMQKVGGDGVKAAFEWDAGGTGQMFLRWDSGRLVEFVMVFAS
jgi:steroid delta-isomerase